MNLWPLILKSTTIIIKMYSMIIKMCKVLSKKLKFWEVLDQKPGYQSISLVCSWEDLVTRSLHGCNSITGKPLVFLLVSFPQSLALFYKCIHIFQLSWIIREIPSYRANLPLLHTGDQNSQIKGSLDQLLTKN